MRTCETCHEVLVRRANECRRAWEAKRFCSRACLYVGQRSADQKTCPTCKKQFFKIELAGIRGKAWDARTYCSRPCIPYRRGPDHHNWNGGQPVRGLRFTWASMSWAVRVKRRDHYTCQLCGTQGRGRDIHADHIKSLAQYPELRLDLNNGRTLCAPCHRKTPSFGRNLKYLARSA